MLMRLGCVEADLRWAQALAWCRSMWSLVSALKGRAHLWKAGNPRVLASLYMAAVAAKKINPEIKELYERLCDQRKSKLSALGACM